MVTKEEVDSWQCPIPLTLVCPQDVPRFQEARNVLSELWDSCYMLSGGEAGRGQKCENRWKCNFLMTAADGKKTQECVRTMLEPFESAGSAVMCAV